MSEVPNDNSVQPTTLNNNEPKTLDHEHTLAGSSSLSASVTSLDNVSVASSKISKPSGIRPPSKIGRLCGNHHKPAIPTTPPKMAFGKADMSYYDSSDDSIRRITDGFGRHRLTDVLEDSEDGDLGGYLSSNNVTTRNRYSSFGSTTSSLDALWDLHPHRLSEAGLSRHSDSSNVLTEDTDSFIIGQRVWVSGNKPGHIAFIGETQFAPGEWAGIALDDAIGKNDGSVGGTRYFQCEPKKGVFSRLTRLTREPLEGASPVHTPSPVNNIRNSISPTGSTQGLMRSPVSMCGSNISLSSAASHVIDFKMGDRVIIKSSQGSKVGTVRYMGATEFAAGDWVGVELDDPRGKNDGSVNGKRYFECRPNFGLFAPITKVSKSPSKVKPGSCQIHGGAGLPPSGIRRANSKESLFSNMSTTSAASTARRKSPTKTTTTPLPTRTALQDVLKEKQRHIEQLLKEREEAEQKLTAVEQEYKKYRDEHNRKLEEDGKLLNTVKEINTQLTIHIEEERRKTEDIQFRLEETVICKDDLETKDKKSITKIEELEMQLIKEKQRNDSLEVDANKLFEAEENLIKFKEEIDTLKEQLQISRSKEIVLEGDHASTAVLIKSLQDEADRYKIDLSEKNNLINVLNQEISKTTSDLTKQLEESLTKYSDLEILSGKKDEDITDLRTKIHEANKSLEEKTARLADIANDKLTTETTLEKEIEKLKMELSAKIFDLDQFQEQLKGKESDSSNLNSELNSLRQLLKDREIEKEELSQQISAKNLQLEDITNKLELKQNEASEKEGNYIKLQNEFVTTNTELTKLKSELESLNREREVMLNSKDSEVLRLIENVKSKEEESVAHLSKYNLLKENHDNLLNQLEVSKVNADTLKKQYEENLNSKDSELKDYCDKTNKYENELAQQLAAYGELKVNYDNKITELQALQTETEGRKSQYEVELNEEKLTLKLLSEKLEGKENEIGNLKKECDTQNTKLSNVESELQRIREENEQMLNEANNKVKDLSNNVHEKEASILSLQTELQTTKIDLESVSNDLRQYQTNLNDVESNLKKERDDIKEQLKEKVKELEDSKSEFANIIAERDLKFQEISKELTNRIKEIENLESNIAKLNEENEVSNKKSVERHMQELAVKEERIQALTSQILEKGNEINTYKNTCSELTESIKQKDLELSKLQEGFLKDNTLSSETILKLNGEIENLSKANKEYQDTNNKLQILVQEKEQAYNDLNIEINKKTEETSVLMEQVNEKDQLIRSLQVDITAKEKELENALHDKQQSQTDKNESEITLRKEMDELRNGFSLKNQELDELKRVFSEKMSQNEIHLNEANDNVTKKSEELELLKQQFSQATIENEDKIKTIDEKYRKEFSDFEIRVSDLLTEIENKDGEIAKLTDLLSSNQDSSKERDGKLTSMAQELSSFSDQVQSQSQIIKKLEEDQSKIVQENERINKQLVDSNQHIQVLSEDKEKLNNELTDLSMSSGDASKKVSELNEIIREKERQHEADKVQNQIIMQKLENTIKELHTNNEVLEKSVHEHETKRKEDLKVRGELDKETQRVKVELSQKLVKVDELEKSLNAVTLTVAERDIQLSRQNSEIRKLKENNLSQGVSTNSKNDIKQLLEEKLFAENQVAFLNSIIADMQKKSEEQKARIEILEMGYNSSAADELTSLGFKFAKQTPPRMYCDICEEFDLHETEDCPTQGEDEDIPTHNQFSTDTKEKLPQRSYCDVCEVFGHATEDCTEDQEF